MHNIIRIIVFGFASKCSTGLNSLDSTKAVLLRNEGVVVDSLIASYYYRQSVLELIKNFPEKNKNSVRWYIDCGDDFLYECNSLVHIEKKEIPNEFNIHDGARGLNGGSL